jgi:uncharacterized protein YfbU (UPF0304 family)
MTLTEVERLSLLNQYLILDKVDPEGGWAKFAKIVQEGYSGRYSQLTEHLYNELSPQKSRFVEDVLSMFDALQRPYIDAKAEVPSELMFSGFDGNNEAELLGYTRFVIEDERRWVSVRTNGDGLNSHFPSIERYRRMLTKWQELGSGYQLSKSDIDAITGESPHPDQR